MAELVDAPDLGSGVERRGGSSPPPGTIPFLTFLVVGNDSCFFEVNDHQFLKFLWLVSDSLGLLKFRMIFSF